MNAKKKNINDLMDFFTKIFLSPPTVQPRIKQMFQKFILYIFKYNLYYGKFITINCQQIMYVIEDMVDHTDIEYRSSRQYSLLSYLKVEGVTVAAREQSYTDRLASAPRTGGRRASAAPLINRSTPWQPYHMIDTFFNRPTQNNIKTRIYQLYQRIDYISKLQNKNMKLCIININDYEENDNIDISILIKWINDNATPGQELITFTYIDGVNNIHKIEFLILILDLYSILNDYLRIDDANIHAINHDINTRRIPLYSKPVNLFHRYNNILLTKTNFNDYFDKLKHLYIYCTENYEQEFFFSNNPLLNIHNNNSLIYKLNTYSKEICDNHDYTNIRDPGNKYNIQIDNSNCIYLLEYWTEGNTYVDENSDHYNNITKIFIEFKRSLNMIEKNIETPDKFNYNFGNIINHFRRDVVNHNNNLNIPQNFERLGAENGWKDNILINIYHQRNKDYLNIYHIINLLWIIICKNNNYTNLLEDNNKLKEDIIDYINSQILGINGADIIKQPHTIIDRDIYLDDTIHICKKIYYNLIDIFFSFNSKKNSYIYEILFELYWILLCGSDLKFYLLNNDKKHIYDDIIRGHNERADIGTFINLDNNMDFADLKNYYTFYINIFNNNNEPYMISFKNNFIDNIKNLFNNLSNIDINTKNKYLLNSYNSQNINNFNNPIPNNELKENIIKVLLNYKNKTNNIEETYEELFVSSIKNSTDTNIKVNIEYSIIDNYDIDLIINNRLKFSNINDIFNDYDNELTKLISILSKYTESVLLNNKYIINYIENLINLIFKYIKTKELINNFN